MAEKNLIDPSTSADLTPTSDYISHHLTNLTYGWCEKTQSWGFANHQQSLFSESSCKVTEMGFWAFHVDTLFFSVLLGGIFLFVFSRAAKSFSLDKPTKLQLFVEMMIDFINGVVKGTFKAAQNSLIAPMALTIFFWVLLMNVMDLVTVRTYKQNFQRFVSLKI